MHQFPKFISAKKLTSTCFGQFLCPKHVEVHFLAKINLGNWCISWFYYKEICYDSRSHELTYRHNCS